MERENREEQEVEARCVSLRSPAILNARLKLPWSTPAVVPAFPRALAGSPYQRPGLSTLFVPADITCDISFSSRSRSISTALSHVPWVSGNLWSSHHRLRLPQSTDTFLFIRSGHCPSYRHSIPCPSSHVILLRLSVCPTLTNYTL